MLILSNHFAGFYGPAETSIGWIPSEEKPSARAAFIQRLAARSVGVGLLGRDAPQHRGQRLWAVCGMVVRSPVFILPPWGLGKARAYGAVEARKSRE